MKKISLTAQIGIALVFTSAGIPVGRVAVVSGIDRIIDMGRTVMSATSDTSCAVVMQRIVGEKYS